MTKIESIIKNMNPTEKILFYIFSTIFAITAILMLYRVHKHFLVEIPTYGGQFTEGVIGSPRFINPILSISDTDRDLVSLVYSGLLKTNLDGSLSPDLAETYQISEDGTIYSFKLKENIYFHDGKEVTSDDVAFTIEKIIDPVIKSPRKANWDGVTFEKINNKEFKLILNKAYHPFIQSLTVGILPKHIWEKATSEEFPFSEWNINPIGSGPYKINKISRNSGGIPTTITLSSWNKYLPEKPKIKSIAFKFFQNETDLIKAYSDKSIDSISGITQSTAKESLNDRSVSIISSLPRVFGLFFNQNISPVFLNKEVRQALDISAPKQRIVDEVLYSYGKVLNGPIPTNTETNPEIANGNIEKAKALLEKSGWESNEEGFLFKETKEGKTNLSFTITTSDSPELKKTALILQETWREIGADVNIEIFEQSDLSQNIIKGRKYEALLFGKVAGENADLHPFWHSSQRNDPGLNISLFANISVDKALEEMQKGIDIEKNKETVIGQIKIDKPAIFLFVPQMIYIPSNKIKNINLKEVSTTNERFVSIDNWYIETEKVWRIFTKKSN
jgi:peptide/nickel transport system substrate-binding protein